MLIILFESGNKAIHDTQCKLEIKFASFKDSFCCCWTASDWGNISFNNPSSFALFSFSQQTKTYSSTAIEMLPSCSFANEILSLIFFLGLYVYTTA